MSGMTGGGFQDGGSFGRGGIDIAQLDRQARVCGVNPMDSTRLIELASVGVAALAWRESPVEDWHAAQDGIGQAEMMRLNAAATRTARDHLRAEAGVDLPLEGAHVPSGGAASIFASLPRMLADPQRGLPDGCVLRDLAPDAGAWEEFERHVCAYCGRWAGLETAYGLRPVLVLLACHAVGRVRKWWLLPDWPARVQEFLRRLDDPEAWDDRQVAYHLRQQPPPDTADRYALGQRLLDGPDRCTAAAADYCLRTGLGLLAPSDYGWPGYSRHAMPTACRALVVPLTPPDMTRR
ncbi:MULTISPECIES: hypothetical protein [unclassified Streptomyces]|uniref:hypothetical protein n=1 Tax=unclassified Streptomyces TaxID=2593676 RepID=UPI00336A832E